MMRPTTLCGVERKIATAKNLETKYSIEKVMSVLEQDGYVVTCLEGYDDNTLYYEITTDDRHNSIVCIFKKYSIGWVIDTFKYTKSIEK